MTPEQLQRKKLIEEIEKLDYINEELQKNVKKLIQIDITGNE